MRRGRFGLLLGVMVILVGARFFAPAGVYVRDCDIDSLAVTTSAVQIARSISLGLIYPDTSTMNTSTLQFDVSRNNSAWSVWRDVAGDTVQIINSPLGGFVDLTAIGGSAIPGWIRVRLGAATDTCRVDDKTFYFVIRQGG